MIAAYARCKSLLVVICKEEDEMTDEELEEVLDEIRSNGRSNDLPLLFEVDYGENDS